MRLTIDSSEPLDDVLRVIGAAYGVVLSADTTGVVASPSRRGTGSRRNGDGGRRSSGPSRKTRDVSVAEIRDWARAQGMSVSDRGRIRASIVDAYQAAHH